MNSMNIVWKRVLWIALIFSALIGCSDERDHQSENITLEEFIQAIQQFKPESQLDESLIDELRLQHLKVNDQFDITWTEHTAPGTDLPILAVFNKNREPIYVRSFRERIETVKYIGEYVLDRGLIEVTSYGASGSFSGQWVDLLMLNEDYVHEIWQHQTISNDSHLAEDEGSLEYLHQYSTYLIMPADQQRFTEVQRPYIIVNQTLERIDAGANDQVISREKETTQLRYIWDEEQLKFVEE